MLPKDLCGSIAKHYSIIGVLMIGVKQHFTLKSKTLIFKKKQENSLAKFFDRFSGCRPAL